MGKVIEGGLLPADDPIYNGSWMIHSGRDCKPKQSLQPGMSAKQNEMTETMRQCLEKCVAFAISKNAWISAIDYAGDYEVTTDEALEFLKECRE
jgi:hypothetical protein